MEIPAKNTIGLSIKKVTFTSVERKNRHLSYNFTLFHFFFLTHKDHTKTFTTNQKSKFMQYIYEEGQWAYRLNCIQPQG